MRIGIGDVIQPTYVNGQQSCPPNTGYAGAQFGCIPWDTSNDLASQLAAGAVETITTDANGNPVGASVSAPPPPPPAPPAITTTPSVAPPVLTPATSLPTSTSAQVFGQQPLTQVPVYAGGTAGGPGEGAGIVSAPVTTQPSPASVVASLGLPSSTGSGDCMTVTSGSFQDVGISSSNPYGWQQVSSCPSASTPAATSTTSTSGLTTDDILLLGAAALAAFLFFK